MKELNIVSLEGYEVDAINSTFEKKLFLRRRFMILGQILVILIRVYLMSITLMSWVV